MFAPFSVPCLTPNCVFVLVAYFIMAILSFSVDGIEYACIFVVIHGGVLKALLHVVWRVQAADAAVQAAAPSYDPAELGQLLGVCAGFPLSFQC
jgi:hypothetical protein